FAVAGLFRLKDRSPIAVEQLLSDILEQFNACAGFIVCSCDGTLVGFRIMAAFAKRPLFTHVRNSLSIHHFQARQIQPQRGLWRFFTSVWSRTLFGRGSNSGRLPD